MGFLTLRGCRSALMSLLAVLAVLALTACGDVVQFAEPPQPADSRAPLRPGHPLTPNPHAPADQPAAADPFDPADVGSGSTEEAGDPNEVVYTGTVTLGDGVVLPDPAWMWISAGHPPTGRPPVLTKLHANLTFPLTFELKRRDTAFPGAAVPKTADLVLYVSVGKSRFVEGIVLKVPPTEAKSMGTKDINIQVKKP